MVSVVVTTESGVVQVENSGVPGWKEGAWQLEETLRLGTRSTGGSEAEQFALISSLASDSRERLYVLDGQAQQIRVFLEDGTFSHSIGRRGEGPGEFEGAWNVVVGPGDTLTVLDDGNMRYYVLLPDGTVVGTYPRSIVGYGSPPQTRLDDGSYLDWGLEFPEGRMGSRMMFYPVRFTDRFQQKDTFPPIEHVFDMVGSGRMQVMDFGSFPVITPDGEGNIWFANSREYHVYRRTLEGDTTLTFTLSADPIPLGPEDRQYVRQRWEGRPEILAEQLDALPEAKPLIYGIVPDHEGHVLVFADVAGENSGTVLDVFKESGEYQGRLILPDPVDLRANRQPVIDLSGSHLALVVRDELDVPYVSRLRLNR